MAAGKYMDDASAVHVELLSGQELGPPAHRILKELSFTS